MTDPSWYKASPLKVSSHQLGRPPSGRTKMLRGNLVEADKGIFDRLLSSAAISMFDDDEDHSLLKAHESPIIVGNGFQEECFASPSLETRGSFVTDTQVLKSLRKVTFSPNLIRGSSSGSLNGTFDPKTPNVAVHDSNNFSGFFGETGPDEINYTGKSAVVQELASVLKNVVIHKCAIDQEESNYHPASGEKIDVTNTTGLKYFDSDYYSRKVHNSPSDSTDQNRTFLPPSPAHDKLEQQKSDDDFLRFTSFLRHAHKKRASEMLQLLDVLNEQTEDIKTDYYDEMDTKELESKIMMKVIKSTVGF